MSQFPKALELYVSILFIDTQMSGMIGGGERGRRGGRKRGREGEGKGGKGESRGGKREGRGGKRREKNENEEEGEDSEEKGLKNREVHGIWKEEVPRPISILIYQFYYP